MSEPSTSSCSTWPAASLLLTAVLVLWRRELAAMIRVFAVQGVALAGLVAVLAVHEASAELGVRRRRCPGAARRGAAVLLRRALTAAGPQRRETRPLVNVAASLLAAAGLTLLAYAVSAAPGRAGALAGHRRRSRSGWPWS